MSDAHDIETSSFLSFLRCFSFWKNDWRKKIADSELPLDVQDVVSSVVVQSRLMNFEKVDVAEDLLAHFQDGSQRGKSFESLISKFGEPEIVAELIRSSKLRSRSMFIKMGRLAFVGVVLAGVIYVGLALFFQMGTPNPATDFSVAFNSNQIDVAEEDSAWSVLRDAWTRHEFSEGAGGRFEEIYKKVSDEDGTTYPRDLVKPTDEEWDAAIAKLADSQDLLDALREGAKRPSLGLVLQPDRSKYSDEDFAALFPGVDKKDLKPRDNDLGIIGVSDEVNELAGGSLAGMLLPHIQSFRIAARILVVDTRWAIQMGDPERAAQNVETIFGLANLAADSHCLVCDMVGFAICDIGYDLLDEILIDAPDQFDEPQLARIQSAVAGSDLENWIQYDGERAFINDLIQRIYTDDGSGDGRMTSEGVAVFQCLKSLFGPSNGIDSLEGFLEGPNSFTAPVSLLFVASRQEMTAKVDQLFDELEKRFPLSVFEDDMADFEASLNEPSMKYFLINYLFPAVQSVRFSRDRGIGNRNGMLIAIAAHRYRLEFGEWPDSAEALAIELLPSVPLDICSGNELNYKLNADGFVVYSTGIDGDDDRGVRPFNDSKGRLLSTGEFTPWHGAGHDDGDWVSWPRRVE